MMDRGQWAETEAEKWMLGRARQFVGFAWHRYPDARAAQGKMSLPQPSDYLIGWRGKATNLEVKETKEKYRLPRTKIRQYGKLKIWAYAGFGVIVLVYCSHYNDWVVLTANDIFPEGDETPTSFLIYGPQVERFPSAAQALERWFP